MWRALNPLVLLAVKGLIWVVVQVLPLSVDFDRKWAYFGAGSMLAVVDTHAA